MQKIVQGLNLPKAANHDGFFRIMRIKYRDLILLRVYFDKMFLIHLFIYLFIYLHVFFYLSFFI